MLRLRKPHPCGASEWEVVRLGADIGLRCLGCGRRVLLERSVVERRLRQLISRAGPPAAPAPGLFPGRVLSGEGEPRADVPAKPRRRP